MDDRPEPPAPSATPAAATIVRGLTWTGAGHVAGQACWFGSLIVLGAVLPPKAFGTVAAATAAVTVATVLMGQGTRGAIVAAPDITRAMVTTSVVRTVVPAAAAAVVLALLAPVVVRTFAEGGSIAPVRFMAASIVLNAVAIVPLALLQKRLRFARKASIAGISSGVAGAVSIVAALLGAGVWALVVRLLVYAGLQAAMGWWSARDLVPPRAVTPAAARRPPGARAFLFLSIADFVALTCDNLIVGQSTDASRLGLYSLAFTLAFAPLTQFSWQIGTVLFPAAAATDDLATVARRTLRATRMTALILVPLVVPSLLLAPVVIPAVLGDDWRAMVAPFQLLLVTGVGHGIVNVIGESLSGKGGIRFRAWLHAGWALATVVTVAVLVNADGIRGAALAHLILFVPLAGAYATRGIRMLGSSPAALWRALRRVAAAVAVEAAAGAAVWWLLDAADASAAIARTAAAIAGLVVAAAMLGVGEHSPVRDAARSFRTRSA